MDIQMDLAAGVYYYNDVGILKKMPFEYLEVLINALLKSYFLILTPRL